MTNQEKHLIAYLGIRKTKDDGGYIGGLLIINDRGIPRDFRCTSPLRPNVTQRALYGDTLESHISVELLGLQLLDAITLPTLCCVVEDSVLLELRERVDLPIVHIEQSRESDSSNGGSNGRFRLESSISGVQPVTIRTYQKADYEAVGKTLGNAFGRIDLLEPFDRITSAIDILSVRDDSFA